jgi:hypothetical protein
LIEVLLTTVLAAVLLVALWSLLSMYSKAFESGQAKTEQAQLARVLLEQFTADLQSAVQPPPVVPPLPVGPAVPTSPAQDNDTGGATSDGGTSSGGASQRGTNSRASAAQPIAASQPSAPTSATSAQTTSTETLSASIRIGGEPGADGGAHPAFAAGTIATSSLRPAGVFGTENYLQVDVLQPVDVEPTVDAELDQPLAPSSASAPSRAAELKTIIYSFEVLPAPEQPLDQPTACLMRREVDWEAMHPAARSAGSPMTVQPRGPADASLADPASAPMEAVTEEDDYLDESLTRVPEVLSFALRYFDGSTWHTEWDSAARRALPVAIEVAIQLRSHDEPDPLSSDVPVEPGVDLEKLVALRHPVHRLLIPLPAGGGPPPAAGTTPGAGAADSAVALGDDAHAP